MKPGNLTPAEYYKKYWMIKNKDGKFEKAQLTEFQTSFINAYFDEKALGIVCGGLGRWRKHSNEIKMAQDVVKNLKTLPEFLKPEGKMLQNSNTNINDQL